MGAWQREWTSIFPKIFVCKEVYHTALNNPSLPMCLQGPPRGLETQESIEAGRGYSELHGDELPPIVDSGKCSAAAVNFQPLSLVM